MTNGKPDCKDDEKTEFETCGIFVRPMVLEEVGNKIDGHTHNFDHLMICLEGSAHVVAKYEDGTLAFEDDFSKGGYLAVQKNLEHEITATSVPYKHFCIFPSRFPNGKVAGENTGWFKGSI